MKFWLITFNIIFFSLCADCNHIIDYILKEAGNRIERIEGDKIYVSRESVFEENREYFFVVNENLTIRTYGTPEATFFKKQSKLWKCQNCPYYEWFEGTWIQCPKCGSKMVFYQYTEKP